MNAGATIVALDTGGVTNDWISLHRSLYEILPDRDISRLFHHHGRILVDVQYRGRTEKTFAYTDCEMNHSLNDFTMQMRGSTRNFPNGSEEITIRADAVDDVTLKLYYHGPARIIEEII